LLLAWLQALPRAVSACGDGSYGCNAASGVSVLQGFVAFESKHEFALVCYMPLARLKRLKLCINSSSEAHRSPTRLQHSF